MKLLFGNKMIRIRGAGNDESSETVSSKREKPKCCCVQCKLHWIRGEDKVCRVVREVVGRERLELPTSSV